MKKYYSVTYKMKNGLFCANIAHAESVETVGREYEAKYQIVEMHECSEGELEGLLARHMPVVEL